MAVNSHTESRDSGKSGALLFCLACPFFWEREVQKMSARQKYKRLVCVLLTIGIIALGWCGWAVVRGMIPEQMKVCADDELPVLFHNAFDSLIQAKRIDQPDAPKEGHVSGGSEKGTQSAAEVAAEGGGTSVSGASVVKTQTSYDIAYSLFGKIPLKTVSVSVVPRQKLYAGGTPIGIYLETDGVLVVDTGEVVSGEGSICCPAENIVKSGDYIQAVNGEAVNTKEELIECIGRSKGNDVVLDVNRGGESISLRLAPVQDRAGDYKAGIWVRNDTQGIGTLTYLTEEGKFGALGHGISDIDTGEVLKISGGTLYQADVLSVVKGEQGVPGELSGVIHYSEGYKIGEICENRENGIYGSVVALPSMTEGRTIYETAHRQEVQQGSATILCSVDGACREYAVRIREVRLNGNDVNKGMVLEVTDPELLEQTGGIVQGMSGSPILQNGRIVGAVTHVFVNDPTRGYGIFIENMLEY